jgi:hypothetical protein
MSSGGKSKNKAAAVNKGSTPEKGNTDSATVSMLQGQGFEIIDGTIKDANGLTTETQPTIIEKILENEETLCGFVSSGSTKPYARL